MDLGAFLGGLGSFLEKLSEFAEKGEQLSKTGELRDLGREGKLHGIYGFNVKVGLGGEGIKVEPFGNVRKDAQTGAPVVHEIREPMVDVFEEPDQVLVVAEMPGISEEDVRLELVDDVLTISAERGEKKYRKEVLLPQAFSKDEMTYTCRNGVLEARFSEAAGREERDG